MEQIIDKLNERFNSTDSLDISAIIEFKNSLEIERDTAQNSLSQISKETLANIEEVEEGQKEIEQLAVEVEDLEIEVVKHQAKVQRVEALAEDYIKKINLLEKAKAYIETVGRIEEASRAVETSLNDRGGRAISEFTQLCTLTISIKNTSCSHLIKYLNETIHYWHSVLKDRLSKEYEDIIKNLKWPFMGANVPPIPSPELLARFQNLTETLIQIQLPDTWHQPDMVSDATTTAPLSLPISVLIRPLKKRFLFHFSGARQTNQPEKPEWYFTQILTWIRDHQEFIEKHLQPVYDKIEDKQISARVEFTRGLVQVAMEKLHWDLPHLQYDDVLFSHTVDEALSFAKELREGYGYPDTQPSVLSVLTQAHFFVKWINLEKKYSLEKLDSIMCSESGFHRSLPVEDGEYTVECVDKFLTLLMALTERYSSLPQPGHRLQFLQLQLELLDDFRVRLLQLLRANEGGVSTSSPTILNAVSCLIFNLEEWSATPHFLQLQYYHQKLEACNKDEGEVADKGVFDEVINLLSNMQEDLLLNIVDSLVAEVKARSRSYRRDCWHAMEEIEDGVTPSSIQMFHTLTAGLWALRDALTPRLRTDALSWVAKRLDEFLFEELVLQASFSKMGVKRFILDVRHNLFPLFRQYIPNPQVHFPKLADSCTIFSLDVDAIVSLHYGLEDCENQEFRAIDLLFGAGVTNLTPDEFKLVASRRMDLDKAELPEISGISRMRISDTNKIYRLF